MSYLVKLADIKYLEITRFYNSPDKINIYI